MLYRNKQSESFRWMFAAFTKLGKSLQETRVAGSPCRQGKDTSSTTALPAHIKSKQQESESIAIPASAAASGATLMSGLLEAVSQQD